MKYTVFVSYSWENDLHQEALTNCLCQIKDIDIKLDKIHIPCGQEIWNSISNMLDESDCVVAILTDVAVKSFGVYQELVRAHDRGIEIIPLCHKNIHEEDLPSFLRPINRLSYSDEISFMEALKKLRAQIERLREQKIFHGNPRKRIQSLLAAINSVEDKQQPFRLRILDQILEGVTTEVRELSKSYTLDLGVENNFLLRARPLFNSANKVFAVSVDYVSMFWLKPDLIDIATQYVRDQLANTVRLFVFETPASAHRYMEILEAHNRRYGSDGAVLLCSLQGYLGLLRTISGKPESLLNSDFAVLLFDGYQLAATLDSSRLHFHQINLTRDRRDISINLDYNAFKDIMLILSQTTPGEINSIYNDKFSILRWSGEFVRNRKLWANNLKLLFKNDLGIQGGDLYHFVFLNKGVPNETIVSIRNTLLGAKEGSDVDFQSVWLGRQLHLKVDDGIYHGAINTGTSDNQGSLLMFHFENENDLRVYYSGVKHSIVRRELYEALSDEIKDLYKQMDDMKNHGMDVSQIYERIESLATPSIQRWDFVYDEKIDDLVTTPPYRFPYEHII